MRRIVEPARRAARMRQGDVRDAVHSAHVADSRFKRDLSPKTIDGETAEQKDHTRLQKRELLIEPWSAERDLGRRGSSVAATGRGLSRKALGDRGAVRQVVLVDPGLREPTSELGSRAAAERLAGRELDRAGRLADDRDAVTNGSCDDWTRALEIARGDAFRAGTDSHVKTLKCARAISRC